MTTRFRVTSRCAKDDLNLSDQDAASREARFLAADHEAIRCFIGKRADQPGSGEKVSDVEPNGAVKSLHVGQGRAATIYDEAEDVCWLLAYSATHAIGERRDVYKHFMRLSDRGELLPTEADYKSLMTVTDAALMDALKEPAESLYQRARAAQDGEAGLAFTLGDGRDVEMHIAVELIIDGTQEAEQGWLSITFPPDAPIEAAVILDLIADLLPASVNLDTVSIAADMRGRAIAYNELAVTWEASTASPT